MTAPTPTWQQELANGFDSVEALCRHLNIDRQQLPLLTDYPHFPLRVPRGFVDCMQPGDPNDPLLRQVLPLQDERLASPGFLADPVGDLEAIAETGVLHKYHGRVLLITTGACAIHCRYCFRRNFPYGELQLSRHKLQQAINYIAQHNEISEVILSGGDPLLLSDDRLGELIDALTGILHVKRIRVHSRLPIVLPSRITDGLLQRFSISGKQLIMVLHANHAQELSHAVANACQKLKQAGFTLLNQSVLLRGVNDDADSLCTLSERLFELGALPYYLHLLDRAIGTAHFELPIDQARQIHHQMRRRLPGYLLPRLVQEQAGALHKLTIG